MGNACPRSANASLPLAGVRFSEIVCVLTPDVKVPAADQCSPLPPPAFFSGHAEYVRGGNPRKDARKLGGGLADGIGQRVDRSWNGRQYHRSAWPIATA
jgi:hypothetical protein